LLAAPPIRGDRSKAVDQSLLELIPAIKSRAANLVNNRKTRERCENPD
jgi:hypothetical protein